MSTKKRSSMAAVDSAQAKQKADFDKAVAIGVELKFMDMVKGGGEKTTIIPLRDGVVAEIRRSMVGDEPPSPEDILRGHFGIPDKSPSSVVGKPSSQFTIFSSELMGKITDLGMVVDNLIDQLKPVIVADPPPAGELTKTVPCQIQSEFVEFIECAGRRVDALREKIADTMARVTL